MLLSLFAFTFGNAAVSESPLLSVKGDAGPAKALQLKDLQGLPAVTVDWEHHGEKHSAHGAPLLEVLKLAGWAPGPAGKDVDPKNKHSGLRFVAVLTAADGYQAVFSLAELSSSKTSAVVAWAIDDKPLSPAQGPLRLVVPTDVGMGRSIYQVQRIELVDMRRVVR